MTSDNTNPDTTQNTDPTTTKSSDESMTQSTTVNISKAIDNRPHMLPQDDNLHAIGKFTHICTGNIKRRAFRILYDDDGEPVDKDNQIVLVADDGERYLDPNQNNIIFCKTPCTKFTKISTRTYEDNTRFSDDNDNYFYIEYQIDPTILDNIVTTPCILIKDRRCLPLVTEQCGQIRKYKSCCKTHYLIVCDENKCADGPDRLEPKNVGDISYYKHCKEVKFSYVSLDLLGFCECTVHIDSIGCNRKHCC